MAIFSKFCQIKMLCPCLTCNSIGILISIVPTLKLNPLIINKVLRLLGVKIRSKSAIKAMVATAIMITQTLLEHYKTGSKISQ